MWAFLKFKHSDKQIYFNEKTLLYINNLMFDLNFLKTKIKTYQVGFWINKT